MKCTWLFPAYNGRYAFVRAIAVCFCVLRRQRDFFGNPVKAHRQVRKVLTLLRIAGATPRLKTCKFFTETVDYLGNVIRQRRFENSSHTTDAIRRLNASTNLTELRSFLGLCIIIRQLVPNSDFFVTLLNRR